jgi:hypothetical protein
LKIMQLVQVKAPKKATSKTSNKSTHITFESVLTDALVGVSSAVEALTDLVQDPEVEPKDRIGAAKTLAQILVQLADAQVTEKLPLLEEIAKNVRNKSA